MNTGDFDERNLAKSRAVIDAMDAAAGTDMRALTQRERKILDMWPKFEDGEYVWFGDEVDGLSGGIESIDLFERAMNLYGMFASHIHLSVDERVKLHEPEVLDVDGVEIKVGDTVWHEDGSEWIAEEMNRYGARCFDGDRRRTFDPRSLTHTSPKVLDADGVPIRKGDTVWFKGKLTEYKVAVVLDGTVYLTYKNRNGDNATATTLTRNLTHTHPDSWELLEEDAQKNACDYFGVECDSEAKCRMCPHFQDDRDCSLDMNADIVRRAKKLAGVIGK